MTQRIRNRILQHIAHKAYEPRPMQALAEEMGVEAGDMDAFREALRQMTESGQVVLGASNTVALAPPGREVSGRFVRTERGFGFIVPDMPMAHGDLFVPARYTMGALTGDLVRAKVVRGGGVAAAPGRSPYSGRIVEILKRTSTRFTGVLDRRGGTWFVNIDGKALTEPVIVPDATASNARLGDKVVVELTKYPEGQYMAEGVITEVLGKPGDPDVETTAIRRQYGLADKFPEKVLEHAREVVRRYNDEKEQAKLFEGRTDLRDVYTLTIDPPDARDFDDAISIEDRGETWELGVHIADVAAFVTGGSPLDEEARERGNSTYLPRVVVPMLPELLSNGICSLQPGVPRLTRSAFITYDRQGHVKSSRFATSIIESNHRLTYIEAQALIDGDEAKARAHAKYDAPYTPALLDALRKMHELSLAIRGRRMREGMIVLDLPEVNLLFDEQGNVVDAEPEDDSYTHKLIEAFMVEANEAVARVFAELEVPLIRRIHPEPSAYDAEELRAFARVAGYNIPRNPTRKELQSLIESVRGKPAARAVHFAVLRTLTKAVYSPQLIGHFALASEHYTHFTSPIRRYPDLLVHRAMDAMFDALDGKAVPKTAPLRRKLGRELSQDKRCLDEQALLSLGRHCSATERNSEAAERELRTLLVLKLLEKHVGEVFAGTVTGVTSFGVFVQIDKFVIDGMIRLGDLPGSPAEGWKLNPNTGSLTAQRSGRTITIGDQFKVRINRVDLGTREMDLLIADGRFGGTTKQAPTEAGTGALKPSGKGGRSKLAGRSKSKGKGGRVQRGHGRGRGRR